jgi:PAS domain S-box-containing protein
MTKVSKEKLEHQRFESLINSMVDGVLATNENGKIELYNGAALNVLDVNAIKKGDPIEKILKLKSETNDPLDTKTIILQTKRQTYSRDYKISYQDGSDANIYLSISPIQLGYGKSGEKGFVLIIRDITREKSLEEERDEFISVISHELRTPIAITEGAISNAQLLAEKQAEPERISEALESAHKQVVFLEGMINDLSTLSRAERGVLDAHKEQINLHDFIQGLEHAYTPQAEAKNLKFHTAIDPSLELIETSRLYLQEILQNFITNAIKYSKKGTITVSAEKLKKGVRLSVTDSGIGISKGDQARVFDKFFRSEDFQTREQNGTGLGLYVTRKLADLIDAKLSLESELGKGSTFIVTLPNA